MGNNVYDISSLKPLKLLEKLSIYIKDLSYPPIWFVKMNRHWGSRLGDYQDLEELPYVEKIWQLLSSNDENNQSLAMTLACSQGWTEDDIYMYRCLLRI